MSRRLRPDALSHLYGYGSLSGTIRWVDDAPCRLAGTFRPVIPVVCYRKCYRNGTRLNFGFAPFSPGIERPYLYSYAYPLPAEFGSPKLPSLATWHTAGWTGVVVPYDDLVKAADPEAVIEETFAEIYQILLLVLG